MDGKRGKEREEEVRERVKAGHKGKIEMEGVGRRGGRRRGKEGVKKERALQRDREQETERESERGKDDSKRWNITSERGIDVE